jgi:hypothetical protein
MRLPVLKLYTCWFLKYFGIKIHGNHTELLNLCISRTIFFYLVCEAMGTAATPGLLCQPRVTMKIIVEKQMECRLAAGETGVLGESLPRRHFCPF